MSNSSFTAHSTFDIITYIESAPHSHIFEPLYALFITKLLGLGVSSDVAVLCFQIFLIFLCVSLCLHAKEERFSSLVIVLMSVFFILSYGNALRQGASIVLLLHGFFFYKKKFFIIGTACLLITPLFHFSSVFFIFISFLVLCYNYVFKMKGLYDYLLLAVFAFLGAYVLGEVISYTTYGSYQDRDYSASATRVSLGVKLIPISFIFFISLLVSSHKKETSSASLKYVSQMRFFLLAFVGGLALLDGLPEVGARVLLFYFGLELCWMLLVNWQKKRRSVVVVLLGYTFAINAWNILGGFNI
ncbi:EpsG family protein [Planktomarina temperata]|nr:EpsG family protein [Planktomarina temperata]